MNSLDIERRVIEDHRQALNSMIEREVALRNEVNRELWEDFLTESEQPEVQEIIDVDTLTGMPGGVYERSSFDTMAETADFLRRRSTALLVSQMISC